jgi:hypothetical protein
MLKRRMWPLVGFVAALAVAVPAAWAVGWTNVGPAGVHLYDIINHRVSTANPVYSSQMRLYVQTHSPCGGPNFHMGYVYPNGSEFYAYSTGRTICTAAETPSYWNVAGGNKFAICEESFTEPTNPPSTCQRYSTT